MDKEQSKTTMDAYFQAVGEATTAHGMMEMGFSGVFRNLLDAPIEQVRAVWAAAANLGKRLQIAKALTKASLEGDLQKLTLAMLKRVESMADKRASIAHGSVVNRGEIVEDSSIKQTIGFTSNWTLETIIQQAQEFREIHFELAVLADEIIKAKALEPN